MSSFVILGDACCDLTKELRERFDIEYIKAHIQLPDKTEIEAGLEWDKFTSKEFYTSLRKKGNVYTTSPANSFEYAEVFKKYAKEGKDVLSFSLSSGLSGTYNFSLEGRKEALKEYPNAKIICIDSLRYSSLLGLMMVYASNLRSEGKTIEETAEWIEENKNRFHQMGWVDDLTFLAKQGRLSNSAAFLGQLVGIKPLGDIDYNGMTTVIGKVKGEKNGYEAILKYIEGTIENPSEQIMCIAFTHREKQAMVLKQLVEERIKPKEILVTNVFPSCGVNIGPGLMAAYYVGKPISKDLEEEKTLMNSIINK